MSTRAVILAAGQGQKLNLLHTPKPLILIYGKPLIIHQIERLQEAVYSDITVVVV